MDRTVDNSESHEGTETDHGDMKEFPRENDVGTNGNQEEPKQFSSTQSQKVRKSEEEDPKDTEILVNSVPETTLRETPHGEMNNPLHGKRVGELKNQEESKTLSSTRSPKVNKSEEEGPKDTLILDKSVADTTETDTAHSEMNNPLHEQRVGELKNQGESKTPSSSPSPSVNKCNKENPKHTQILDKAVPGSPQTENQNKGFLEELLPKLGLAGVYPRKAKYENILALAKNEDAVILSPAKEMVQKLMCLDYRGRKGITLKSGGQGDQKIGKSNIGNKNLKAVFASFSESSSLSVEMKTNLSQISSHDAMFAIYHCCDPFLFQELMSKMSECQLAVPLILPQFESSGLTFLLWGLRKIRKRWRSLHHGDAIIEKAVVSYPIPTVFFIRVGSPKISKSSLLNKLIGPTQGKNEHCFFIDNEHDVAESTWSTGIVEAVWYTPEGGKESVEVITKATSFFNLRGDSRKFSKQTQLLCRNSDITVAIWDETSSPLEKALGLSKDTKNLLVVVSSQRKSQQSRSETQTLGNVTVMDGRGQTSIGLCGEISEWLNSTLLEINECLTLEQMAEKCDDVGIDVDEKDADCLNAKAEALSVLAATSETKDNERPSPPEYKQKILPLQTTFWKKWALLDKNSEKLVQSHTNESVEHTLDRRHQEKLNQRKLQVSHPIANEVGTFVSAIASGEQILRKHFLTWFHLYLNEMSIESLTPLLKDLRELQQEKRKLESSKTEFTEAIKLQEFEEGRNAMQNEIDKICQMQQSCDEKVWSITKKFEDNSLGFEHFIRELGQIYESHMETKGTNPNCTFDVQKLPDLAANMLIDGYPLEILDGDVGHVALRWVKVVLKTVLSKLSNPFVFVVSVIGIQNSGKSTLLNNMFGVNFAVSAGRCTRGVFIQLVPVNLRCGIRETSACDYIILIDTEGLKAPERSLMGGYHYDNELATFALCLSDLTLINISGQTVGKDMTDILQIASHAFIRMKQVNLKPSCRIVQQFVSDLTAVDRNETGTQSILITLDETTALASEEEGFGEKYKRFSDVFQMKLEKDLQYIPNLYGGSMCPPNHSYSEALFRLRDAILEDAGSACKPLSSFIARVSDVWNAIKEEDFIFSFQNSIEVLQYKRFQLEYGRWVAEMRQAVLEWEVKAKQTMKNTDVKALENLQRQLQSEVDEITFQARTSVEEKIQDYLYDNVLDEEFCRKFSCEFLKDINVVETDIKRAAYESINHHAKALHEANDIHDLLEKCKNEIRVKAQQAAIHQREQQGDREEELDDLEKKKMQDKFEDLWRAWVDEIENKYSQRRADVADVRREFEAFITERGSKVDLTKDLRKRLHTKGGKFEGYFESTFGKVWHDYIKRENSTVKSYIDSVKQDSMEFIKEQISCDMAYDPDIAKQVVFRAIEKLSYTNQELVLSKDKKIDAIIYICSEAITMIFQGRQKHDEIYSLRNLLQQEKERLKNDFVSLCSKRFHDEMAVQWFFQWLKEQICDIVRNDVGLLIYRTVSKDHFFLTNKFSFLGTVLHDVGSREDFLGYYKYIFETESFFSEWTLDFISKQILKTVDKNETSCMDHLIFSKVDELSRQTLEVLTSTSIPHEDNDEEGTKSVYHDWLNDFLSNYQRTVDVVFGTEEFEILQGFAVTSTRFFKERVEEIVRSHLKGEVIEATKMTGLTNKEKAKSILQNLPVKPHLQIVSAIKGCGQQCPFCKAPCDITTKNHEKHRSELHYPEGIIGAALMLDDSLICDICTSSVASDAPYRDNATNVRKLYKDYANDFPDWYIQPVKDDTPKKYWKWVLNHFNDKFANMFALKKANIPDGWKEISKEEALQSLSEAYLLNV